MTVPNSTDGRCSRDCQPCRARSPTVSSASRVKTSCRKGRDAPTQEFTPWRRWRRCNWKARIPERNLVIALNDMLPASVRINSVEVVPEGFHARHSAKAKTYRYRIYRGDVCPPFLARYVYHDPYPMDEDAVIRAADQVVGKHDFTSFAASDPDRSARIAEAAEEEKEKAGARFRHPETGGEAAAIKETGAPFWPSFGQGGAAEERRRPSPSGIVSNVRTIHSSLWARTREELIYTVRGDGFLHHMVRNLVGTFLLVGKGSLQASDVPTILEARNRSAAGPTAAACGLYLVSVEY